MTVAVMLIPQSMAYALLAGLPPIYGMYAALIPCIVYPFLGTSRFLAVGPVAMVSVLVLSGLSKLATPGTQEFIELAIFLGLISGLIQILMSFFRLGFMVKFLSQPVLKGFTSAAAIIILVGQLPNVFGVKVPSSSSTLATFENIFWSIGDCNFWALGFGLGGFVFLLLMKKINSKIPAGLILFSFGIFLVYYFNLEENNLAILGEIPSGLPGFQVPKISLNTLEDLFPLAIAISLISFIESLAISKSLSSKNDDNPVDPDKELNAIGFSKVIGAFFQAYPTSASFSRTAVNENAGAKTGVSSIITAILVAFGLLFLTGILYYLPKAILAAIVLAAVIGLIDIKTAKFYYKTSMHDFWIMLITFLGTIVLGIQNGILLGIFLSVGYILYRSSLPHYAILGRIETENGVVVFRNVDRFKEAIERKDLLMIRFDAPIYFGNAEYFREIIWNELNKRSEVPEYLLLDFSSIHNIDATGMNVFGQLIEELKKKEIDLLLTNVQGKVRDKLKISDLGASIGAENQFLINLDAYNFSANPHNRSISKMKYASQTGELGERDPL